MKDDEVKNIFRKEDGREAGECVCSLLNEQNFTHVKYRNFTRETIGLDAEAVADNCPKKPWDGMSVKKSFETFWRYCATEEEKEKIAVALLAKCQSQIRNPATAAGRLYRLLPESTQRAIAESLTGQPVADIPRDQTQQDEMTQGKLDAILAGQETAAKWCNEASCRIIAMGETVNRIDGNTRPKKTRRDNHVVRQQDAADILTRMGLPTTKRTIQNWEAGEHTPDGYSREKRLTLEAFTAWAKQYKDTKVSKENLRNALEYKEDMKH